MTAHDLQDDYNRDALMIRQERECEILGCSSDTVEGNTQRDQRASIGLGKLRAVFSASTDIPADAEESYSDYLRERDHQQEERDQEEAYWNQQRILQEETDDGYHEFGFKHEPL